MILLPHPHKHSKSSHALRPKRGQSLIEFVLAIPFLLLCLVSIVYFGKFFYTKQVIAYAAQEGARAAARIPNLSDSQALDTVRGFTTGGAVSGNEDPASNPSAIYRALSAGKLLSGPGGASGSLPQGARVVISPFDDGTAINNDRVTVTIEYPFGLFFNPQTGANQGDITNVSIAMTANASDDAVPFQDFLLSESASAAQEVYQQ